METFIVKLQSAKPIWVQGWGQARPDQDLPSGNQITIAVQTERLRGFTLGQVYLDGEQVATTYSFGGRKLQFRPITLPEKRVGEITFATMGQVFLIGKAILSWKRSPVVNKACRNCGFIDFP